MKDLTVKALEEMIDKIIADNKEVITEKLFLNTNNSMTTEEIVGYMFTNYLSLSMKLSIQATLELLRSQGVLEIDEHEIAKLYLKHLSFGKEEQYYFSY